MAHRWSSQHVIAEHRDLQVNAMAVDFHGQLALLAGRRTIAVVDLNKPTEVVTKVPRQSKWQIDAVQWNPHASHAHLFVTACNQRADIWSCDNQPSNQRADIWSSENQPSLRSQGSLRAHTRVISDLDWSPHHANTIATCSVDTFTHLWDCRDLRKPRQSMQGIAGVSQVKWNKHNSHYLATCHDGDIRLWDARKGNQPFQYIAGHLSKIHGLDWSPHSETELATSSQDGSVKFWDINQPRQAIDKMCPSNSPVWRARYTPFGRGLMTVVVPQLRRGENSLLLWSLQQQGMAQQVHTFVGHSDVVLEFQWRHLQDKQSYQLVTWSKDQSLRLWTINPIMLQQCGVEVEGSDDDSGLLLGGDTEAGTDDSPANQTVIDIKGAASTNDKAPALAQTPPMTHFPRRDELHSPQQPKTLKQEFALVNFDLNNVKLEETDAVRRKCRVTAVSSDGEHVAALTLTFPEAYPCNAPPTFTLNSTCSAVTKQHEQILSVLNAVALQHVHFSRSCIEPCLRQLVTSLDALKDVDECASEDAREEQQFPSSRPALSTLALFPPLACHTFQDRTVPFPRTSGARFSSSGLLICFTRKTEPPRRTTSAAEVHPRALGDLSSFGQAGGRTPQRPGTQVFSLFSGLATTPPPSTSSSEMLRKFYDYKDTHQHTSKTNKRSRSKSRSHTRQDSFKLDGASQGGGGSPKKRDKQSRVGPVIIYDVQAVTPIDRHLAENYVLDTKNVERMCNHNKELASSAGRQDLVQLWSIVALTVPPSLHPSLDPADEPWACNPFGRQMLKSLIDHYASLSDVQTLAMLTCAIGSKYDPECARAVSSHVNRTTSDYSMKNSHSSIHTHSNYNTYHTIHSTDRKEWSHISKCMGSRGKRGFTAKAIPLYAHSALHKPMKRSNSWSDMREEYDYQVTLQPKPEETEKERHLRNVRLVDPYENHKYDQFKRAYADILYKMGLITQRAQVLKYVSSPPETHTGIEFKTRCHYCDEETRGVQCFHNNCRQLAMQCVICHVAVRGACSFCLACGHGGHSSHMMQWFTNHVVCPSGCGCHCLQENPMSDSTPET